MNTVYDWLTVALFGGLIVLFLQRSSQETHTDHLWQYFPPALGCGIANYFGNEGNALVAVAILVATLAYIGYVLKPFPPFNR